MSQMQYRASVYSSQLGFTLPELLIYVAVLAVAGVWLASQFGNVSSGANLERAFTEIEKVRTAAVAYRISPRRAGSYNGITIASLSSQGYNIRPLSSGTGENVYGNNVVIVAVSGGADAKLTYTTDTASSCQQLIERYTNVNGIKGTPACATSVLTVTLD